MPFCSALPVYSGSVGDHLALFLETDRQRPAADHHGTGVEVVGCTQGVHTGICAEEVGAACQGAQGHVVGEAFVRDASQGVGVDAAAAAGGEVP